jgi:iron complex outermembrane recepter protein
VNRTTSFRRRLAGAAALSLSSLQIAAPALAQAGDTVPISIPVSPLGDALRAFSAQADIPVIFNEALVSGRSSSAVSDTVGAEAALGVLLEGTGLEAVSGGGGYTIREKSSQSKSENVHAAEPAPVPERVPPQTGTRGEGEEADLRIDRVTITGTSLRGIAPESSPLQIYSREDILGSGVTTTEQFIRTLPQNFGGGSTEFAAVMGLPNDSNSQFNSSFGTSANLRGLGSRGTLTLLNGSRIAPSSEIGDFVDVSLIPLSAIERIDVLTDGASSIYGGDAVAGVMNFILRDDFDGAETSLRYGAATGGAMEELRAGQTLGKAWSSGNILGTYEYHDRGSLTLADRPQIPAPGLSGPELTPFLEDFDLLPEQRRHSAVLSLRQDLAPGLELSATGLYSSRKADSTTFSSGSTITTSNFQSESDVSSLVVGLSHDFSATWRGSYGIAFSDVKSLEYARNVAPVVTEPRLKTTSSDLWSADGLFDGPLFRLPGGEVRAAVGAHYREERFSNALDTTGANRAADRNVTAFFGELFLPLIGDDNSMSFAQRLEVSLSGRQDDYSDYGSRFSPKVGVLWAPAEDFRFRGSYSESFAPPPLGRVGDLGRTGAVMPYTNILRIFGVQAPTPELANMNYLQVVGTAGDLDAETSSTLTLGFDAEGGQGDHTWRLRTSYYDISFDGRLGATPIPQNLNANLAPNIAFANPDAFPDGTVVFFPAQAEIDSVLSTFNQPVIFIGGLNSVSNIGIINNAFVVRNLAATETSGLDIQMDYEVDTSLGAISAGLNANYILEFGQQASTTSPVVETLDTFLNPVALQVRGQAGYRRGGFSGNLFVNYRDSYRTDTTANAQKIDAWTTVDLSVSYALERLNKSWLDGTEISLSVTNLFDELPPLTPTIGTYRIVGYDPTNANPLRRVVGLEVRKSF